MDYSTYYKKNRDVILKSAKDYYYNNTDTIRKKQRWKNLKEEKEKNQKLSKKL